MRGELEHSEEMQFIHAVWDAGWKNVHEWWEAHRDVLKNHDTSTAQASWKAGNLKIRNKGE